MTSFAELFNEYRVKAGFQTLSQFGMALANEGFVYEDSIFSKWKSGERVPRDRQVALALLKVLIKYKAFSDLSKANEILASLDLRDLSHEEESEIAHGLSRNVPLYSEYKPLIEPSYMYQKVPITPENTRMIILSEMESPLREYWQYQVDCAVAQHFSLASGGIRSPSEIFNHLRKDEYDNSGCTATIISITTDPSSGQEYLSACDRMTLGTKRLRYPLNFMKYIYMTDGWEREFTFYDVNEVAELDRYVITNWAWEGRTYITSNGYAKIVDYVSRRGIKILYALVSQMILAVCIESRLPIEKVDGVEAFAYDKEKEGLFLSTFVYGELFNSLWNKEYFLYRFYCKKPDIV